MDGKFVCETPAPGEVVRKPLPTRAGRWIARFRDGPLEDYARHFAVGPIFEEVVFAPVREGARGEEDTAWALVSWDALPVEHPASILVRYVLDDVRPGCTEDGPPVAYYVSVGSLNGTGAARPA